MNFSDSFRVFRCPQCDIRLVGILWCPKCGTHDVEEVRPTASESAIMELIMKGPANEETYRAICVGCGISFQTNYLTTCPYCAQPLDAEPIQEEPKPDLSKYMDPPNLRDLPMAYSREEYERLLNKAKLDLEKELLYGKPKTRPMSKETFAALWGGEWRTDD